MTAPERIWVGIRGVSENAQDIGDCLYVRADLIETARREGFKVGLEAAADVAHDVYGEWSDGVPYCDRDEVEQAIRAIKPDDHLGGDK